jgi:hypothetical protein
MTESYPSFLNRKGYLTPFLLMPVAVKSALLIVTISLALPGGPVVPLAATRSTKGKF